MKKAMFTRVCAFLAIGAAVIFGSNQVRAEEYNVVRAAISAGCAPEYAGGKRVGYSYSETFPVAALFDGVSENTTPTNGWVGGILSAGYAEVKLPEAYFASVGTVPEVTTYKVHRFNYGNAYAFNATYATGDNVSDIHHAPTAWKLEGTANGRDWVTIDEQTGIEWGEAEYVKTFSLATAGKYTGFRFVPTSSWRFENRSGTVLPPEYPFDVGLMEIEYLAESAPSAAGVLFVTSDYPDENVPSVVTASGTVSAPSCGYDGKKRFGGVTGYTLSTWTDGAWVDGETGSGTSYDFAADGSAKKLTWHFAESNVTGYRLDAQVVAPGYESFTFEPAADSMGYYDVGAVVEVTPVEHAEPPYSYFHRWEGDGVTSENAKTKVLTVTMDGAKVVKCWFDRAWKRMDGTTEVTPLGYFATRSGSTCSTIVFDGCHAYIVKAAEWASAYGGVEGAYGGAAMTLSPGGRVNFTLPVWASEKYTTGKWTSLLYAHTLGAAELVAGPNITDFGSYSWHGNFGSWPNLVHVEGFKELDQAEIVPQFTGSGVTNDVMDLTPPNAVYVVPYAFSGSKVSGTVVDLPKVQKIGSQAFSGTGITTVIATNAALCEIGNNATSGSAFRGMSALTSIVMCATNITKLGWDFALPRVSELWFTSTYPAHLIGQSRGLANWTTFESKHNTYIYASKKLAGWKEHVLPVSEFTETEKALMPSGCFGIVTNYLDSSGRAIATMTKRAWAVHRASPDDPTGLCIRIQ